MKRTSGKVRFCYNPYTGGVIKFTGSKAGFKRVCGYMGCTKVFSRRKIEALLGANLDRF